MKILIATGIYPPDIGGPASFSREFAREVVKRGHTPVVLCYGGEETKTGEGWSVVVVPRAYPLFFRYFLYAWRVYWLSRKTDLIFLQGPVSEGFPGMLGALLARKPVVMKIVGDYAWESYRQIDHTNNALLDEFVLKRQHGRIGIIDAIQRWSARRAQCVITPSEYLKRIVSVWGVSLDRIRVIYNAVPALPAVRSREELRTENGFLHEKIILTVVRAVPWKHGDFLCEALSRLPMDFRLVIVGDGPSLQAWKQKAQQLGVSSRVLFTGKQDRQKVAEWYAMADVFALPSGYEGFPHVVAEAASTGLSSFVSDKGGNPETMGLFKGSVLVLPYLELDKWVEAFLQMPSHVKPLHGVSFEAFIDSYLDLFSNV